MQLGCPAPCCISVTVRERKDESQQGGTYLHEVDTSSLFHKEQIKRDRLTQRCTRLRVSAGAIAQIAWHLSSFPSPVHSPRTVMQVIWKCCPGKARLFHYQHMEPMGLIPDGDITVQRLCLSPTPKHRDWGDNCSVGWSPSLWTVDAWSQNQTESVNNIRNSKLMPLLLVPIMSCEAEE